MAALCGKASKGAISCKFIQQLNFPLILLFYPVGSAAEQKADINKADMDGQTPLYIAAEKGRLETVQALVPLL